MQAEKTSNDKGLGNSLSVSIKKRLILRRFFIDTSYIKIKK